MKTSRSCVLACAAIVAGALASACVDGTTPDCGDAACGQDLGDAQFVFDAGDAASTGDATPDAQAPVDAGAGG
jgi:hypothetical protein